ncbi:hypothetical protein, partial [Jatrophihabitans sp.]|uniref:hypothetical protein n=1 Tax=Jatrophihabitans sp. TaxID=1932789 RepID=UPI002EF632AC
MNEEQIASHVEEWRTALDTHRKSAKGRQIGMGDAAAQLAFAWGGAVAQSVHPEIAGPVMTAVAETYRILWGSRVPQQVAALDAVQSRAVDRELMYAWHRGFADRISDVAKSVLEDPVMGRFFDNEYGARFNLSSRDSSQTLVENHPDLVIKNRLSALLTITGGLEANDKQIKAMLGHLRTSMDTVSAAVGATVADIAGINDALVGLGHDMSSVDYKASLLLQGQIVLLTMAGREADEKVKQAEREARQATIRDAHAAAGMLGSILGVLTEDPHLGKQVSAVADFAVELAAVADSVLNPLEKATTTLAAMGSGLLTGNVVGAAIGLVTAFIDMGPSTDELVLAKLGELQQQVAALGKQMDHQFRQVDRRLTKIYESLADQLGRLRVEVGRVQRDLQSVHDDIVETSFQLNDVKVELLAALQGEAGAALRQTVSGIVDWPYVETPRPPEDYRSAEQSLYSHAVDRSATELWLGTVAGGDEGDAEGLARVLESFDPYYHFAYVLAVLASRGIVISCSKPLNLGLWSFAATAYGDLEYSDPQVARTVRPSRHDEVAEAAEQVKRAITALAPYHLDYKPVL